MMVNSYFKLFLKIEQQIKYFLMKSWQHFFYQT